MRLASPWSMLFLALVTSCMQHDGSRKVLRPTASPLRERVTVRMSIAVLGHSAHTLIGGDDLHPGDELRVSVEAERRVFVYLLDVTASEVSLVYPQANDPDRVELNAPLVIPPGQALRLGVGQGAERFVLIASAQPLAEDVLPDLVMKSARRGGEQPADAQLRDQLKDPNLIRRQKQRLIDQLRATVGKPACAVTQGELDAEGIAVLCLSFLVRTVEQHNP